VDVKGFEGLVKSEVTARRYLVQACRKNGPRICPRCQGRKLYVLGDKERFRCALCRYTFGAFTGRWVAQVRLTARQWLWVVKLFELEVSARRIAQQLSLSYPTALRAVTTLRRSLLAGTAEGEALVRSEVEADEAYFGGRRKGRRGRVKVEVVANVTAKTLLASTVNLVRRGSLVYTDCYQVYDALMFCGYRHLRVDHDRRFSRGKVHINGLEGFWAYAKERLIKHHGVSHERFPLYLKEMEFRYNHRHQDLFPLGVQQLTNLVPKLL
jgi:transposase